MQNNNTDKSVRIRFKFLKEQTLDYKSNIRTICVLYTESFF